MNQREYLFQNAGGKLLTFQLGEQEYGIPILQAREVVGLMHIDPVPQTQEFVKGIINLRGKIISVIDLRSKFGMEAIEETKEMCIIIVDIQGCLTGVIVDFLVGVLSSEEEQFEDTPQLGSHIQTEFLAGVLKLGERVVIVLDVEKILSNEELEAMKAAELEEIE